MKIRTSFVSNSSSSSFLVIQAGFITNSKFDKTMDIIAEYINSAISIVPMIKDRAADIQFDARNDDIESINIPDDLKALSQIVTVNSEEEVKDLIIRGLEKKNIKDSLEAYCRYGYTNDYYRPENYEEYMQKLIKKVLSGFNKTRKMNKLSYPINISLTVDLFDVEYHIDQDTVIKRLKKELFDDVYEHMQVYIG